MKRIFVSLFLVLALAAPALAQQPQQTDYNPGKAWATFSQSEKEKLVFGIYTGIGMYCRYATVAEMQKDPENGQKHFIECVQAFSAKDATLPKIVETMSGLYADSKNGMISWDDIFVISINKLRGQNVDKQIQETRARWESALTGGQAPASAAPAGATVKPAKKK